MNNNDAQEPDEPVLTPILASLAIQDIPALDLQLSDELDASNRGLDPTSNRELEATKGRLEHSAAVSASPSKEPLLCRNVLVKDQLSTSFDSIPDEYAGTSGSEHGFTSDSDSWTDDGDDGTTSNLTSHGPEPPLASTSSAHHPSLETSECLIMELAALPLTPAPATRSIFENHYFTVARSAIAGWGAFAARDLKCGDLILVEKPLFTADSNTIFQEFDKLSAPLRETALGLHANDSCKPGLPKLKAVWMTNCFSTGGDKAGLFPIASRFNHACHPKANIDYSYNHVDKALEMVVRVNSVKAGQELTISYGTRRTPADLFYRHGCIIYDMTSPRIAYDGAKLELAASVVRHDFKRAGNMVDGNLAVLHKEASYTTAASTLLEPPLRHVTREGSTGVDSGGYVGQYEAACLRYSQGMHTFRLGRPRIFG
ncbi:hypothetical protein F66182_9671 [Fusarium sp. NRRL 66182]|nr:hypothetical protein F66182_9671 [Fusarium sp. NRRL 66182]